MFQEMRAKARGVGDAGMVRAMDAELERLGVVETTEASDAGVERAVPEKPRRGRRPLPRCEHNMIADRCPECNDELALSARKRIREAPSWQAP